MSRTTTLIYATLLSVLIGAMAVGNLWWLWGNRSASGPDTAPHLNASVECYRAVSACLAEEPGSIAGRAVGLARIFVTKLPYTPPFYPNGVYFVTVPFYALLGLKLGAAAASNYVFACILGLSTYGLSMRLTRSRVQGLLAVFLVMSYPLIFESMRKYGLDFPLTAMTALCLWMLVACDAFRDARFSLLLGISVGLGMLIKAQLLIFIAFPLLFALFKRFTDRPAGLQGKQGSHMALFLVPASLLSMLWWNPALYTRYLTIQIDSNPVQSGLMLHRYSLATVTHHAGVLMFSSTGVVVCAAFIGAFFVFLKYGEAYPKGVIAAWLLGPLCVFSFLLYNPEGRHLMPLLPAMAIVTSFGVFRSGKGVLQALLLGVLIAYAASQYWFLSFSREHVFDADRSGARFFGGSPYGGALVREDPYRMDAVGKALPLPAAGRGARVLLVTVHNGDPYCFAVKFWLKMAHKDLDVSDLIVMQDYDGIDTMDYILCKVPDTITARNWSAFDDALQNNEKKGIIPLWRKVPFSQLLQKLYARQPLYDKSAEIPTAAGFTWVVYAKKDRAAAAGDALPRREAARQRPGNRSRHGI